MCIEYSGSSALMTLSVYALPGKMLRMNQAADRSGQDRSRIGAYELLGFGQDRSILLRIDPLEWSRIDADQSESAVQTQCPLRSRAT